MPWARFAPSPPSRPIASVIGPPSPFVAIEPSPFHSRDRRPPRHSVPPPAYSAAAHSAPFQLTPRPAARPVRVNFPPVQDPADGRIRTRRDPQPGTKPTPSTSCMAESPPVPTPHPLISLSSFASQQSICLPPVRGEPSTISQRSTVSHL